MCPKIGTVETGAIATAIWAAAARTLTDFSAEDLFDLPAIDDLYLATPNPSSGALANTYGAWIEAVADIGTGKRLIWLNIIPLHDTQITFELEVGEGAAGSEVAVARIISVVGISTAVGPRPYQLYYLWKSLTDNARLSVRVKDETDAVLMYACRLGIA